MREEIKTVRLFLREMDRNDFDALYKVLTDTETMRHYPYAFDEACVSGWIERNKNRYRENGFGLWAVCLMEANGYEPAEPMFNIDHVSPHETQNPDDFVTEICYPVKKRKEILR